MVTETELWIGFTIYMVSSFIIFAVGYKAGYNKSLDDAGIIHGKDSVRFRKELEKNNPKK